MRIPFLLLSLALVGCSSPTKHESALPANSSPAPNRGPKPVILIGTCPNLASDYPVEARRRHETGTVVVEVEVNASGQQTSITIAKSSGSEILDRATVGKFKECKFQPAYSGESPTAGSTTLEYKWELN